MDEVLITAVLCTYNRESYLNKAIQSLREQTMERRQYEILIVDNASQDGTARMVRAIVEKDPQVRYVYEPIQGLSQARNTAWTQARGRYVAYLDDDALAAPGWLESIMAAFRLTSEKTGCVGGRITPLWEAPRPEWLPEQLLYYLGNLDLSSELTPVTGPEWLGGGNSAYPKAVLAEIGGFDVSVGRKGGNLLSMEDTLIQQKIIQAGYDIYYHPEISILHAASPSRLRRQWFEERSFWEGISQAHTYDTSSLKGMCSLCWTAARAAGAVLLRPKRWKAMFSDSSDPGIFLQNCLLWKKLGFLRGFTYRIGLSKMS